MEDLSTQINSWMNQLKEENADNEKIVLLKSISTAYQDQTNALERVSKRLSILEDDLRKRLPFQVEDYAIVEIEGEHKVGQIAEVHIITLAADLLVTVLSPHFYPVYMVDMDKLKKPTKEEIQNFESNRLAIEEGIKKMEENT